MQPKHTPGPWSVDRINDGIYHINSNPKHHGWSAICEVRSNGLGARHVGEPETELNARLIGSSPDLLEACKEILRRLSPEDGQSGQCWLCSDALHPTDDDKTIVDYLRDIIAKAS